MSQEHRDPEATVSPGCRGFSDVEGLSRLTKQFQAKAGRLGDTVEVQGSSRKHEA